MASATTVEDRDKYIAALVRTADLYAPKDKVGDMTVDMAARLFELHIAPTPETYSMNKDSKLADFGHLAKQASLAPLQTLPPPMAELPVSPQTRRRSDSGASTELARINNLLRDENELLKSKLEKQTKQCLDTTARFEALTTRSGRLEEENTRLREADGQNKQEIKKQSASIAALEQEKSKQAARIAGLTDEIQAHQKRIAALESDNKVLIAENKALMAEKDTAAAQTAELSKTMQQMKEQTDKASEALAKQKKDTDIKAAELSKDIIAIINPSAAPPPGPITQVGVSAARMAFDAIFVGDAEYVEANVSENFRDAVKLLRISLKTKTCFEKMNVAMHGDYAIEYTIDTIEAALDKFMDKLKNAIPKDKEEWLYTGDKVKDSELYILLGIDGIKTRVIEILRAGFPDELTKVCKFSGKSKMAAAIISFDVSSSLGGFFASFVNGGPYKHTPKK